MPAMSVAPVEIRAPRAQITLPCTLRRTIGSPIPAQTLERRTARDAHPQPPPAPADETVGFDLPGLDMRLNGRARVICEERPGVYAMRFEGLPEPMTRRLHALAINAR